MSVLGIGEPTEPSSLLKIVGGRTYGYQRMSEKRMVGLVTHHFLNPDHISSNDTMTKLGQGAQLANFGESRIQERSVNQKVNNDVVIGWGSA